MSVALSIVFTGLCALVTDGDRAPAEVLLVDAEGVGEVAGFAMPRHAPSLVVGLGDLANAQDSMPTRVVTAWPGYGSDLDASESAATTASQLGIWDLTGSTVRIRVQGREGTGVELYRPGDSRSSWPDPPHDRNDANAWRDLRFMANMETLSGDGRIDPSLVAIGSSARLPRTVAARIHLDTGRLYAGIPTLAAHRRDVYEFRGAKGEPGLRQALTDTFRWSLESDTAAVVIEISPLSEGPVKRLVLSPRATPYSLFVSNLPAEGAPHENHATASDEEMGVQHFATYYFLLMNEPDHKPLPWLVPSEPGRNGAGLHGKPRCSGAMFRRR